MPEDDQHDRNIYHALTSLIKFVVADRNASAILTIYLYTLMKENVSLLVS